MENEQQFLNMISERIRLNAVQLKAVRHSEGPLLLLASPGSGKTTTIISRIAYLILVKKIVPKQILAVSFSKASAQDLQLRFEQLFPDLVTPICATIHSLAYKIMRTYFQLKGQAFYIIEGESEKDREGEQAKKGQKHITKLKLLSQLYEQINKERIKEEQLEELVNFISLIKNKCLEKQQRSSLNCSVPQASELFERYEDYKKQQPNCILVDYDDMLAIALEALQQSPDILKLYQRQFKYVLTDESQDTSIVQHRIIELLVEEHNQLFVVADDDQAIYSWRGADVQYLLKFKTHYPDAEILFLQQNYRSTQKIVHAANRVIKQNKSRYIKVMMTENESGEDIIVQRFANGYKQVNYITEQLQQCEQLGEVAILYRNHMSNILLINELDKRSIPFYMKDADDRFFNHWVIQDILNIMRLSYSDKHFHIFESVAMKLQLYISGEQLNRLKLNYKGEPIFSWLEEQMKLESYQKNQLSNLQTHIPLLKQLSPKLAIVQIREQLGYNKVIKQLSERLGFKYDYLMSILDSLELIAEGLTSIIEFVDKLKHLEAVQRQARRLKNSQAVTLSTLHSAKGLEFDTVYMMDLNEGVIPSRQDTEQAETMEEAVRLFYVGMTRARKTLYLLSTEQWFGQSVMASRFVRQLSTEPVNARNSLSQVKATQVKVAPKQRNHASYADAISDPAQLKAGVRIEHMQFGSGEILSNDGSKLKINFVDSGEKILLITVLLERQVIRLIS